jgi:adenylylsulfate kinase-like enzyme
VTDKAEGAVQHVTGIVSPNELPEQPELHIDAGCRWPMRESLGGFESRFLDNYGL